MKTKIFLGLAVCCLLSVLITSLITSTVQAQAPNPVLGGWPFSVNFLEDPYRLHGLQTKSWCIISGGNWVNITKLPSNKRFIITDILCDDNPQDVMFATDYSGSTLKATCGFGSPYTLYHIRLSSGIVYDANEEIWINTIANPITISGYFVDL